jgi:MFS family permease
LSSSIFIGVIIGTLIGGYIGDKMGRRLVMISAQFFILIFGFLSATANNVLQFAVWRLLTTIGIGLGMSVCSSFIVEIFQKDKRGKIVILTCIAFSAGALVFSWMASVILTDLKNGNWRLLVIYSNIFSIFALLLTVIYQKESPRFLLFDR